MVIIKVVVDFCESASALIFACAWKNVTLVVSVEMDSMTPNLRLHKKKGECFAPICAQVSRRPEHGALSFHWMLADMTICIMARMRRVLRTIV